MNNVLVFFIGFSIGVTITPELLKLHKKLGEKIGELKLKK